MFLHACKALESNAIEQVATQMYYIIIIIICLHV